MNNTILTNLPRYDTGANKGNINWNNTIGMDLELLYKNNKYKIKIIDIQKRIMTIKFNNITNKISINNFSTYCFGNILGLKTNKHFYKTNDIVETKSGKIKILDTIYIKRNKSNLKDKGYLVECLLCKDKDGINYSFEIRESDLKRKIGCPCCSNSKIVKGINDIATTHPHLIKYFVNIEDAYNNSYGAEDKKKVKCPLCGTTKLISPNTLNMHGLGCACSDGFSYPSKLVFHILKQLNLDFETEYSPDWIKPKRYDFYFIYNNEGYIIETHGEQHYEENTNFKMSLEEVQENDRVKKELAIKSGIKPENYIVIDCKKSELEFIKQNILNSELGNLFDLSEIDWIKCEEFALSNLVKTACNYWNEGIKDTKEISEIMNIDRNTIARYLKRGTLVNWCNYNPKEELIKNKCKEIVCVENGKIFESATDCARQGVEIFGVSMTASGICSVCKGRNEKYKGYTFKYTENYQHK